MYMHAHAPLSACALISGCASLDAHADKDACAEKNGTCACGSHFEGNYILL